MFSVLVRVLVIGVPMFTHSFGGGGWWLTFANNNDERQRIFCEIYFIFRRTYSDDRQKS